MCYFKAINEFKLELQSENAQFRSKLSRVTLKLTDNLQNNRTPLLCYVKLCASFRSHQSIQTGVTIRKPDIRVPSCDFFVPCDLEIWRMTLKNNRALLLCYLKICATFRSHRSIQTGITVLKHKKLSIFYPVKSLEMSQVTVKYTIVQLSYATLSFVHHFIAIYEFKMELQSGSAKFGSKSAIFLVPCDLIGIGHFKLELQFRNPTFGSKSEMFVPCGLEI